MSIVVCRFFYERKKDQILLISFESRFNRRETGGKSRVKRREDERYRTGPRRGGGGWGCRQLYGIYGAIYSSAVAGA